MQVRSFFFFSLLFACSTPPDVATDASQPNDAKSDVPPIGFGSDASDAAATGDGCPATCPSSAPAGGAACVGNFQCEYGGSPLSTCDTVATCNGTTWQLTLGGPQDAGWCVAASGCPATLGDAMDAGACSSSAVCHYLEGTCGCTNGAWQCVHPTSPDCPVQRPRIGSPCSTTASCSYGQYCSTLFGDVLTCTCGTWQQAGSGCPPPPPQN